MYSCNDYIVRERTEEAVHAILKSIKKDFKKCKEGT